MKNIFLILIFFMYELTYTKEVNNPVAIFHGFGSSCNSGYVTILRSYLARRLSTTVKCIVIGNGVYTSIYTPLADQVEMACNKINLDPVFQNKFSVIGLSIGGIVARGVVEQCNLKGKVTNYISIASPQFGFSDLNLNSCLKICKNLRIAANCNNFCKPFTGISSKVWYSKTYQDTYSLAGLYRNRYNYREYLEKSSYLSYLNNQRAVKNSTYKARFSSLQNVVLIKNKNDSIVIPNDSTWFKFYDLTGTYILPFKNSAFWVYDWIGLRALNERGKVKFLTWNGDHLYYTYADIDRDLIPVLKQ